MVKTYIYLGIAIIAEVMATTALKSSVGFTKIIPTIISLGGYTTAFFFLSIVMKVMPVGVSYAIWAGVGTMLVVLLSWIIHGQKLDLTGILGLALIVVGVIVVNLSPSMTEH